MTKYVKFISESKIEYPPINKDGIINYNQDIHRLKMDGYKVLEEVSKPIPDDSHIEYQEFFDSVKEILIEPTEEQRFESLRSGKLAEYESNRDVFLAAPVFYKDLDWDSDLDQKTNLSFRLSVMKDDEVCTWVSADGVTSMECTKEDLSSILQLIADKSTYVWQLKNPKIKKEIFAATTVEELEAIDIEYPYQKVFDGSVMTFPTSESELE